MTVKLALAEQLGGETYLYCDADGLPQITLHRQGQLPVVDGQDLSLVIDRSRMHLFAADGRALANGVGK